MITIYYGLKKYLKETDTQNPLELTRGCSKNWSFIGF